MKKIMFYAVVLFFLVGGGVALLSAATGIDPATLTCRESFSDCTEGACGSANAAGNCTIECYSHITGTWGVLTCGSPNQDGE